MQNNCHKKHLVDPPIRPQTNVKDIKQFYIDSFQRMGNGYIDLVKVQKHSNGLEQEFVNQFTIRSLLKEKMYLQSVEQQYNKIEATYQQYKGNVQIKRLQIKKELEYLDEVETKLKEQQQTKKIFKAKIKLLNTQEKQKRQNLYQVSAKIAEYENKTSFFTKEIMNLKNYVQIKQIQNAKLQEQIKKLNNTKKTYNNELQQIKGNVRVYCRIRPLLSKNQAQLMTYETTDSTIKITAPSNMYKSTNHQTEFQFPFQQIFDRSTTQRQIFEELTQLIQSSISGKSVLIFAYGQTGSGKTYTMQGSHNNNAEQEGIIPRSISQIFLQSSIDMEEYKRIIQVSAVQIYNETIKDLLTNEEITKGSSQISPKKFLIQSPQEGMANYLSAISNRAVAATKANQVSSRSHFIFTIYTQFHRIKSQNQVQIGKSTQNKVISGSLTLVDLAGSQRISQSLVKGIRLEQTQNINLSLSSLALVINKIKNDQAHIPIKNSKLTIALQSRLKGDSKVVMFVNVSSNANDYSQTLNSLKFADGVQQTVIQKKK